jgi:hypothetical protein
MHTMDKETAITEARQRFKAWLCRPDSCSVPPLNPQRTNFNFELTVSPHKKKSPAAMQGFSNEVIREEENNLV